MPAIGAFTELANGAGSLLSQLTPA